VSGAFSGQPQAPPIAANEAARFAFGSTREEIPRLREWLAARGREHRLDPELLDRLIYCAVELFTNIVTHNRPTEGIHVRLEVREDEAALVIEDDGIAFDPTGVPTPVRPRSLEEAGMGGLGLHLVRQWSSLMEYERLGRINHLVVRFAADPARRQAST
jgi:anti-sigma regulatory factor (Ser/Thr protein kinase)